MRLTTRTLTGAVVAATAALTVLSMSPAEGSAGKPVTPATAAGLAKAAPDLGAAAPGPGRAAAAALAGIQTRIAAYVAKHPGAYGFGSFVDQTTGRIVLETDAPAAVVSALTAQPAGAVALRQAVAQAVVRSVRVADQWNRKDDVQPYYGGGGITSGGGTCSAGYTVQNGAGTRFMVTAGHCFATGAAVNTESGANVYGTVSNRRLPTITGDAKDMELVGGRSYSGRIFTGGVTSTSSLPVVGAGDAVVGYADYCHSGRTTGENCGHRALSNNAQVCTQTGCKQPVTSFSGGTQSTNGDSGSPFYVKDSANVWIRGHILAGNGTTSYAEPWSQTSSTFGVSIVTG